MRTVITILSVWLAFALITAWVWHRMRRHDKTQRTAVVKLRAADQVVKEAIRVIGYLGLWDDKEFDELSELIDKYEEAR